MTDESTLATYSTTLAVGDLRIPAGGETAYVGVTAATGGVASQQTISNFGFWPLPILSARQTGPNTVAISWPASIGGYVLQSQSNVEGAAWTDVPNPVSVVGSLNQVVVSYPPPQRQFFRLKLTLQ